MEHSGDKNNIFDDNFGESSFSTNELFKVLQWSILQQEVISEIIPLLSKNTEISTEILQTSLNKIEKVTGEAVGIYRIDTNRSAFIKKCTCCEKHDIKSIYPDEIDYMQEVNILKGLKSNDAIYLNSAEKEPSELQYFFSKALDLKEGSWWIFPVQIKELLYGLLLIRNPDLNTVNNLLFSFYKNVSLVFAQAFDRIAVIETNKEMLERVNKANQLKTAFLTNISHEVRTPVNSIVGFSDLLADPDLTIDQREEFINLITQSSRSLVRMFDNIIDASKLHSEQMRFRKEWKLVSNILDEIEAELDEKDSKQKNDKVLSQVEKNNINTQISIYIDDFRLKQIINILFENAREHTLEGSIDIGANLKKDQLHFYVKDSGKGIDKEKHKEVFSLFESNEQAFTFESGGSGLGLSIAKELTEQLGGKLWFESELNKGTVFYVNFPPEMLKIKDVKESDKKHDNNDWSKKQILIAEDVEFNFIFLREIIVPTGAKIIWAKNGEEACRIFDENPDIDLILMDLQMPEMNGYDAAAYIKDKKPQIPIIAQTAFMMANEDEKCFEIGCDDFLSKPIHPRQLIKTIKKHIK